MTYRNMRIHYQEYTMEPRREIEGYGDPFCGLIRSDYLYTTINWSDVTCKNCLSKYAKMLKGSL